LKEGNLRAKYDVIVYPHGGTGLGGGGGGGRGGAGAGGGGGEGAVAAAGGDKPVPYKRTAEFPSLGYPDSTDDIRGAVGVEGMKALYEFVQQGGTLITEGSTAAILPELGLAPGVKVESPQGLFARGTIVRGVIADKKSPLVYGYEHGEVPVYFNQSPVLNAGAGAAEVAMAGAASGRGGRGGSALTQNTTPMATPLKLSPWDPDHTGTPYYRLPANADSVTAAAAGAGRGGRGGAGFGGAGGGGRGGAPGAGAPAPSIPGLTADPDAKPRVIIQFPSNPDDMLLSGTLDGGALLSNRAQLVDEKIGNGHLVMFAIRP